MNKDCLFHLVNIFISNSYHSKYFAHKPFSQENTLSQKNYWVGTYISFASYLVPITFKHIATNIFSNKKPVMSRRIHNTRLIFPNFPIGYINKNKIQFENCDSGELFPAGNAPTWIISDVELTMRRSLNCPVGRYIYTQSVSVTVRYNIHYSYTNTT